jgi:digeranylgeranylglycerophospholipid reductase
MDDIIVIGAGLVGSYIAGKLANHGYNVVVVDKISHSGENVCCTGIISNECYQRLDIKLNIKNKATASARIIGPDDKHFYINRDQIFAHIVDRPLINISLADKARFSGVRYYFSTQVANIEIKEDCASFNYYKEGKHYTLEAKMVIIASGFGTKLTQRLNLGKINNFLVAAQVEAHTTKNIGLEIYLDHTIAPSGFAWLVPTWDNKSLVGLLCKTQPKFFLNKFISQLERSGKITSVNLPMGYGLIPLNPLPRTCLDRLIVVGEAAGQVKPTTGGGIYYGILCADIAIDVINQSFKNNDFTKKRLSQYEKRWRHELYWELLFDYYLQSIFAKLNNKQLTFLMNMITKLKLPEKISNSNNLNFDWHSKIFYQLLKYYIPFIKNK